MRARIRSEGSRPTAASRTWLASLGAALAAACAGAPAEEPPAHPALVEIGREYFQSYCASCHGALARGDGPVAATLRTPPADLTRIAARRGGRFPAGEVARFIDGRFELAAHGTREMPVWGARFSETVPDAGLSEEITRGKIASLVEYLKSIQVAD
jgi:mono/diheme cytochrome c family protein